MATIASSSDKVEQTDKVVNQGRTIVDGAIHEMVDLS